MSSAHIPLSHSHSPAPLHLHSLHHPHTPFISHTPPHTHSPILTPHTPHSPILTPPSSPTPHPTHLTLPSSHPLHPPHPTPHALSHSYIPHTSLLDPYTPPHTLTPSPPCPSLSSLRTPSLTHEGKALLLWWKTLQLLQRQVRSVFWVVCMYLYNNAVTKRGIKMLAHIYNLYIACGLIVSALCHIMYAYVYGSTLNC